MTRAALLRHEHPYVRDVEASERASDIALPDTADGRRLVRSDRRRVPIV
jgi:hypothetical protein